MKFTRYTEINAFYNAAFETLMRNETQNLIPLGNLIIGSEGTDKTDWRDHENWFMATVSDTESIQLVAIMTPPYDLTLYMTDNRKNAAALDTLLDGIREENVNVPGVMCEKSLAEEFAEKYAKPTDKIHAMRLHELTAVNHEIKATGKIRLFEEKDLPYFPYWMQAFNNETECVAPHPINGNIEAHKYHINKKTWYALEVDGVAVSMANISRQMKTVCGITGVYTPPYFRNNGYATSCVAQLSQIVLGKGFTRCALYTDLKNPISNSIYQKIGYKPICDSMAIKFKEA